MNSSAPVVLCILDGWGIGEKTPDNAIYNAHPTFFNHLMEKYPNSALHTSGKNVGLPEGQMGNSEVGHMTIGSGRIIEQDLVRINNEILSEKFYKNPKLKKLLQAIDKEKNTCHLVGLVSDGGVHSHLKHTLSIASFMSDQKIKTCLHIITDGRDTLPKSGINFIKEVLEFIKDKPLISIATLSGRYYSMDRDNRFERTEQAYNVIAHGHNKTFTDISDAVLDSYAQNIDDEFIIPQSSYDYKGMIENDAIIFTNFRSDRMRQIVSAFLLPEFKNFDRKVTAFSSAMTMTSYSKEINSFCDVLIESQNIENTLSEVLSKNNMSQLRIAETEKYAHITFFFNAGKESPYKNEDRVLISSPKIATYDLKPEMSAYEMTDRVILEIESNKYDFIVINYANADMVGHTGNYEATIKAIQHIDSCLKKLTDSILRKNGTLLITADHGNAEIMFDNNKNSTYTSHTTNPVPLIMVGDCFDKKDFYLKNGTLADIAPTILNLFSIDLPKEMTGTNLISKRI